MGGRGSERKKSLAAPTFTSIPALIFVSILVLILVESHRSPDPRPDRRPIPLADGAGEKDAPYTQ